MKLNYLRTLRLFFNEQSSTIRAHWVSFGLILLGFIHALFLFYPGSLSVDSYDQLNQAVTNSYNDWHPPVMAWVWRQLLWIKAGPQPMLLLHLGMFWGGLYLVWYSLVKQKCWTYSLVPLIGFMPPVIAMVGVIWKDIGLGAAVLLINGILLNKCSSKLRQGIFLVALLVYATWVRHNSIGLTFFFILSLPFYFSWGESLNPRQLWCLRVLTGMGLVAFILFSRWVFEEAFLSVQRSHVGIYNLLLDLANIENEAKADLIPNAFKTQNYTKEKVLQYLYDRDPSQLIFIVDSPFQVSFNDSENRKLKIVWAQSVMKYFSVYLKYRWLQYKSLIRVGFSQCRANHYLMPEEFGGGISWMKSWREFLETKTTDWAESTPLFSGWFYLVLAGLGLLLSVVMKSEYQLLARLCFLSTLFYSATYFVGSVSCDFRYVWPTTLTSTLGMILLVSRPPRSDKAGLKHASLSSEPTAEP